MKPEEVEQNVDDEVSNPKGTAPAHAVPTEGEKQLTKLKRWISGNLGCFYFVEEEIQKDKEVKESRENRGRRHVEACRGRTGYSRLAPKAQKERRTEIHVGDIIEGHLPSVAGRRSLGISRARRRLPKHSERRRRRRVAVNFEFGIFLPLSHSVACQ